MIIVTSGEAFTDIDAYAGCIAYAELLRLSGEDAVAVLPGTLNGSIPHELRQLDVTYQTSWQTTADDTFRLVDISDPKYVARCVVIDQVSEVIDHREGNDEYWSKRGVISQIEPIGAAATIIEERWQASGLYHKMSTATAVLLASAILDNSLYFRAHISTERDKRAYERLCEHASISDDWPMHYFSACEEEAFADIAAALKCDTKHVMFDVLGDEVAIGQLAVWDGKKALNERGAIVDTMQADNEPWMASILSISEGVNYFLTTNRSLQRLLAQKFDCVFVNDMAQTNRLWLRKEITKEMSNSHG